MILILYAQSIFLFASALLSYQMTQDLLHSISVLKNMNKINEIRKLLDELEMELNTNKSPDNKLSPEQFAKKYITQPVLLPYTRQASSGFDVWDVLREADGEGEDKIKLLYSGYVIDCGPRDAEYRSGWTREHAWPRSRGGKNEGMTTDSPGMGTDAHNLFAADISINSARSNKHFRELRGEGIPVVDNSPMSGDGKLLAKTSTDSWEPPEFSKGIVARAVLYMACAYPERIRLIEETPQRTDGTLGKLSDILDWNRSYPPTDRERRRNYVVEKYQGNRNPFIDDPTLANEIDFE